MDDLITNDDYVPSLGIQRPYIHNGHNLSRQHYICAIYFMNAGIKQTRKTTTHVPSTESKNLYNVPNTQPRLTTRLARGGINRTINPSMNADRNPTSVLMCC